MHQPFPASLKFLIRSSLGFVTKQLPSLKQKILGKSLPPEKFVLRKGRKFFMQSEYLLLPALEIMYTFGMFPLIGAAGADAAQALVLPELQRMRALAYVHERNGPAPLEPTR